MLTFAEISEKHIPAIEKFNCSDEPQVEEFLKERALHLHLGKTAITRLYFDENQDLVGYFTLHNDLIQIFKAQREKNRWGLANDLKYFPALKIYYLGVDINQRKKYYGEFLLGEVFLISKEIVKLSGCNFIALEAKANVIDFYKKYGFTVKENKVKLVDMILNINDL